MTGADAEKRLLRFRVCGLDPLWEERIRLWGREVLTWWTVNNDFRFRCFERCIWVQGGVPFECRGLPGVLRGWRSGAEASDEVYEEEDLSGGEEDGRVGDETVEGKGRGEEMAGWAERSVRAGDSGELGVVAGFSGEAGEVHGEEGRVGSEEGEPEV